MDTSNAITSPARNNDPILDPMQSSGTQQFIHPEASRSALDRCLRRHGVANLKALPRRKAP
ncbi:MAG: Mobile element protein, partial [Olavius algarvensis Gamma 1 endosymbiont]